MELKVLDEVFAVCKLDENAAVDLSAQTIFLAKTRGEISLVCPQDKIPACAIATEKNWRAFMIEGQLDFSLVGILAEIAQLLAQNEISIFVVSTFDTDYVLVKADKLEQAIEVLENDGYAVNS